VLDDGLLRVLPQHYGTDGAFAARFRRPRRGVSGVAA
jgi:16S rRNA C967 or C1407 C5-methylase (RsmB/RsmF family)